MRIEAELKYGSPETDSVFDIEAATIAGHNAEMDKFTFLITGGHLTESEIERLVERGEEARENGSAPTPSTFRPSATPTGQTSSMPSWAASPPPTSLDAR